MDAGAHGPSDGVAAHRGEERPRVCHARHVLVRATRERDGIASEVDDAGDPVRGEVPLVDEVQVHVVIDEGRKRDAVLAADRPAAEGGVGSEQLAQGGGIEPRHPSPGDLGANGEELGEEGELEGLLQERTRRWIRRCPS